MPASVGTEQNSLTCSHCGQEFPSRTKLFSHLRNSSCTNDAADSGAETPIAFEKVALIIGCCCDEQDWRFQLWKAIDNARGVGTLPHRESYAERGGAPGAIFASDAHGVELLFPEMGTPRVCDVLSLKTEPVPDSERSAWCARANAALPSSLRVLGRSIALCKDFNADVSCQRRCYECLVPLSVLAPGISAQAQHRPDIVQDMQSGYRKRNTTDRSWDARELSKLKTLMKRFQGEHVFHNFCKNARLGPGDTISRRCIHKLRVRVELAEGMAIFVAEADAMLRGHLRSIAGLLIAVQRGLLPEEYVHLALSEQMLVPVPAIPEGNVLLERCIYSNKYHYHLQPSMDSDEAADWRRQVFAMTLQNARSSTFDAWYNEDLVPTTSNLVAKFFHGAAVPRGPDNIDADAPQKYSQVLQLLRDAESSGNWPGIGTGRGKVIKTSTLAEHGGGGGSFTVGTMPDHLGAPAGNRLFPELARRAFELERMLMPERPPSSSIAVNKRAQFLPHVDSGAGAGQGISLIVGLGVYTGGELVVEGQVHDIRYKPLEFNGWTQYHWTQPFQGERFSLVWFTPRGCEGKPGINQDWDAVAAFDAASSPTNGIGSDSTCIAAGSLLNASYQAQDVLGAEKCPAKVMADMSSMVSPRSSRRLSNGWQLPTLAFGTVKMKSVACETAVSQALAAGYKLIDTAALYGNEEEVGRALNSFQGVGGFVMSKCSPKDMGFESACEAFEGTLRRLGRHTLDVYLIHWPALAKVPHTSPQHRYARHQTWRAMEHMYSEGRVRAIGVSNFTKEHLEQLLEDGVTIVPMLNQIEAHPFFVDDETITFCEEHNIVLQAYSPLGGGPESNAAKASRGDVDGTHLLLSHPVVLSVSDQVGRSPASVLLRWGLQRGFAVVPRSCNAAHIKDNACIFDFSLSSEQMAALNNLGRERVAQKFCWDPTCIQ